MHYTLQGNHAHFIVEAHDADALARGMKSIGSRLARAVNRVFQRNGPVLADRFHHRVLTAPRDVRNVFAYVLLNARRHARSQRGPVRIDPASSGRWFDGWRRRVEGAVPRASRTPPVSRPRTWLLRVGWRRHRLLDPAELPGPG